METLTAGDGQIAPQLNGGFPGARGVVNARGYFYGLGLVSADFPSMSVEKLFRQILDVGDAHKPITNRLIFKYLKYAENISIAREMRWVFNSGSVEKYVLDVVSLNDLTRIIAAAAPPVNDKVSFSIISGAVGGYSTLRVDDAERLPTLSPTEIYTFTDARMVEEIINATAVPPPGAAEWNPASPEEAASMFARMKGLADTPGMTDGQRALNFLTVQYLKVYRQIYYMKMDVKKSGGRGVEKPPYSLSGVRPELMALPDGRRVVNVIFAFKVDQGNESSNWCCKVDITGVFPFVVSEGYFY